MQIEDQVFLFHSLEDRIVDFIGFDSTIRIGRDASRVRLDTWKAVLYRKCTNAASAVQQLRTNDASPLCLPDLIRVEIGG